MTLNAKKADNLAQLLNASGYFRGKARIADLLGRLVNICDGARGTFSLPDGTIIAVDLGDRIQRLMWGGAYEPHVQRCLGQLLRPGDIFVDVGAHIGFFSLIASSLVGHTGKVYAFEANPNLFQKLQKHTTEYPWLAASCLAVWKESGSMFFSRSEERGESGWGKLTTVRNEGNIVSVQAISLDEWHEAEEFPLVRIIKIDAEGSEPFILEGARQLIARTRPIMIIELNDQLLRDIGRPKETVIASLRDNSYRIFGISLAAGLNEASRDTAVIPPEVLCVPSEKIEEATGLSGICIEDVGL